MNNNSNNGNSSGRVKRRATARARAAASPAKRPTEFSITRYDMLASAERFAEPLEGLRTREVLSLDVFRHYFGGLVARQ